MSGSKFTKIMTALRNLVINWPPLILFVACLIMFSGVTLILGAYVYNTEDMADNESLSWNTLLVGLQRQSLCWQPAPAQAANGTEAVSALVAASGWADRLPANGSQLLLLLPEEPGAAAGLNVSLQPVRGAAGRQLLCVRLWGPAAALPRPGRSPPAACGAVAGPAAAAAAGALELILDGAGLCAGGGPRYRLQYTPATAWDITLSMADRERAYAHLTCTSAFLVVLALCMLTCSLLRSRPRYSLAAGDKVPLSDG